MWIATLESITQPSAPAIAGYGLMRLVRSVLAIPGRLYLDEKGSIQTLVLCRNHPLAEKLITALQQLLAPQQTRVCLGEIEVYYYLAVAGLHRRRRV